DMSDSIIVRNAWKKDALSAMESQRLFTLNDREFTAGDFSTYAGKQRIPPGGNSRKVMEGLFDQFVEEKLLDGLGDEVMARSPEFRMLANEYYEGILLFDIMERE